MKKKFVSIVLAALMVVMMTAGCGKSEPKASDITASPDSNQATENPTGADVTDDAGNQSETPAPETSTDDPETPAEAPEETPTEASKQVLTLDYDELDAWINYGFMGTSPSGEEVLLGINGNSDYGILIVTDDSGMTFFGCEGEYARSYDDSVDYGYITIAGETFGFKELADGELEMDMGDDLGVTRVAAQTQPILMMRIKEIIDDYTPAD